MVSKMCLRFPWFPLFPWFPWFLWFLWFLLALCGFHGFHGFHAVSMVSIMCLRFPWFPWTLYMFSVVLAVSMVSIGFVRFTWFLWFLCGVHGFYNASPVSMLLMACVVSMRFGWLRLPCFPMSVFFNRFPLLPTILFVFHDHHRLFAFMLSLLISIEICAYVPLFDGGARCWDACKRMLEKILGAGTGDGTVCLCSR